MVRWQKGLVEIRNPTLLPWVRVRPARAIIQRAGVQSPSMVEQALNSRPNPKTADAPAAAKLHLVRSPKSILVP